MCPELQKSCEAHVNKIIGSFLFPCFGIFSAKRVEEKAVEAETNQTGEFGDAQNYFESENYLEETEMNAAQNGHPQSNASIGEGNLNNFFSVS